MNGVGVGALPQRPAHTSSSQSCPARPTSPRRDYSIAEKRGICRLRDEFPDDSMPRFSHRVRRELGIEVPVTTAARIVTDKARWNSAGALDRRRLRDGKHGQLEEALMAWANNWLRHNGALTYSLLQSQAMLIGPALNITDFQYSDGWIWR